MSNSDTPSKAAMELAEKMNHADLQGGHHRPDDDACLIDDFTRNYTPNGSDKPLGMTLGEALDRLAELSAIVERLPKTRDGVPVLPGDKVVSPSGRIMPVLLDNYTGSGAAYIAEAFADNRGDWHDALVSDCYSTRQAAEAARDAEGGTE